MIKLGDICLIDPRNKMNLAGSNILYVKVISKKGFGIFSNYACYICDNEGNILNETLLKVSRRNLVPANKKVKKIPIRYPADIPIINQDDLEVCVAMYHNSLDKLNEDGKLRAAKLIAKLKFFSTIINEY